MRPSTLSGQFFRRRSLTVSTLFVACVFSCFGCFNPPKGSLFAKHMEENPRDRAKERWDGVRGNVTLQLAQQHFRAGRLNDADEALRKVMASAPESSEIFKFAAQLYLEMGRLSSAQEMIVKAARLPGYDAETEYLAGMIAERYGRLEVALSHYKTAQEMSREVPEYVLAAAELYVALGEPAKAMNLIERRIRDFDGCGAFSMLAAKICRLMDRRNDAVNYCREALHEHGDDDLARGEIGEIFAWAGQFGEAASVLRPLVEPTAAVANRSKSKRQRRSATKSMRLALAESYVGLGEFRDARRILSAMMSEDGGDRTAWSLFIRAALMSDDLPSAEAAIQQFHQRNTPTADTLLLEAYVAYLGGWHQQAADACEAALRLAPDLEAARILRVQVGRRAEANGIELTPAPAIASSGARKSRLNIIPPRNAPTKPASKPIETTALGAVEEALSP